MTRRVLLPGILGGVTLIQSGAFEERVLRIDVMTAADWTEVAAVYAEGLATRNATFETALPSWEQWDATHLKSCRLVMRDDGGMLGWTVLSAVSPRDCYRGVAEVSVYVRESARGRGVGRALMEHMVTASEAAGIWTLQGSTFPENEASLRLQAKCGFRVVGRRERVAQLDGRWRDTVFTERRSRRVGTGKSKEVQMSKWVVWSKPAPLGVLLRATALAVVIGVPLMLALEWLGLNQHVVRIVGILIVVLVATSYAESQRPKPPTG